MSLPKPDWRILQRRMSSVKIVSCADGSMRLTPKWRYSWTRNRLGPGLFTRMGTAAELERLINGRLRKRRAEHPSQKP